MARSRWKLNYFSNSIWRKITRIYKVNKFRKKKICYDRSSVIPRIFCNLSMRIHKGKRFRPLVINRYMVGYKIGEFSFTRKPFHYPVRKKKGKKKNLITRR